MASRGVNKAIIVGYLGQNPEMRYMPNGGAVANITVATSSSWRDKQTGENKENTEWHRVVLFGKLAEVTGEYLRKGSQVYIEGQLRTRKWQLQNGQERHTTEIVVNINYGTMIMLNNKRQERITDEEITDNNNFLIKEKNEGNNWNQLNQDNSNDNNLGISQHSTLDTKHEELSINFDDDIPF